MNSLSEFYEISKTSILTILKEDRLKCQHTIFDFENPIKYLLDFTLEF